jgi:hypothetical protein
MSDAIPAHPARPDRKPRQVIHPRITYDLYSRMRAYCARRRISESAVIEAALREYLDQSSDAALIMRRLDRLARRIVRLGRETELLAEFVSVWTRIWFAHTPPLPEGARSAAQMSAAKRYEQMLDFLSKHLSGPKRLVTDLIGHDSDDGLPPPPGSDDGSNRPQ